MQHSILIVTIAAGLGLGSLWPATHGRASAPASDARSVVLERSSDGHYYADAEVNGTSVHFLVDTGSSTIALSEADAKKAGINIAPEDFALIGEGASGMVRGKDMTLDRVKLGEIDQHGVKAAIIEGATTSLLGADYLDTMDEIVIRKDEMTLRKAG